MLVVTAGACASTGTPEPTVGTSSTTAPTTTSTLPTPSIEGFDTIEIEAGDRSLTLAVAETSDERRQGLRGVESLPDGMDGMLFVFDVPRTPTFGMRDTLIPLDIWWFDADGNLIGSTEMEPCTTAICPGYVAPGDVGWALETPLGELELSPGDQLTVPDRS